MCKYPAAICLAVILWASSPANAQQVASIQPWTCQPGQTTRLTVHGSDLDSSLRLLADRADIELRVENIEPTRATFTATVPVDAPMGPLGLWIAAAGGPLKSETLMVDDLPPVADRGDNHSPDQSQPVSTLCVIEGLCDAASSDFYSFHVAAGQRVAFEVHTQAIGSSMDPLLRLQDQAGHILREADDDSVGPDCRFSYQFLEAGNFHLEIRDSRNSAAGARYHLRIGDFPLVRQSFPLAVRRGTGGAVEFLGQDGPPLPKREIQIPAETFGTLNVSTRFPGGLSSAWVPVLASDLPQIVESNSTETPFDLPMAISGRLESPNEVDRYAFRGTQGQVIRIASRTRSLSCPTLLQMQLFTADGSKIAETKVSEADEWTLEATLPQDGDYRLEVADLLRRGGPEFSYWLEFTLAGSFSVALKPEAASRDEFAIELEHGACAFDLQITRFGYEGEIDLALVDAQEGIRILNPRIPAKAAAARIYLHADSAWNPGDIRAVRLMATAAGQAENTQMVTSRSLYRVKWPFILNPRPSHDGMIFLAATDSTEAAFALEPASKVQFARPLKSHTALMRLKKIQDKFKSPVDVLGNALPHGWQASTKADKDTYTLNFGREAASDDEPDVLPLLLFSDFNGHGRIVTYDLPIEWIDPIRVSLEFPQPLVRGGSVVVRAKLQREGEDRQPVTLTFSDLPTGVSSPEKIEIGVDDSLAEFELELAPSLALDSHHELTLNASSKFSGQDFTVSANHTLPALVDSPQQLVVYPSEIVISDPRGRQQLAITGTGAGQHPRDWTRFARIASAHPDIARVEDGIVYPMSDGSTEVVIEVGGQRRTIPVQVANLSTDRPIRFESELLVALSKQGCNSGACHGSPSGKGGFRLSLRAFDKALDELTLIREDFGRRVNPLDPEQSLLLLKPTMKVAHGGGKQLHTGDVAYQILRDWVAGGAQSDPEGTPRVTALEIYPHEKQIQPVLDGGQQLVVTARFADGSRRDVTDIAAYETSDSGVATVDVHGLVTPHDRGEVAILVRYLEHIESVPIMFVEPQAGFEWNSPPENNYVDHLVNAKLKQLQYLPSETCDDSEFIRRIYLDVIGILPTVAETTAFLEESRPDKRERWIDALLEREEYAKFWALKWGDLLKMTSKLVGDEGVYKYHHWVEKALHDNMPYDEFARQLLTASGSTLANPPASFYRTATDMNECVETISQVFLGARLQCAKCHNHPFERWTQDNYYGLGAFFHRVARRKTERPGEMFIYTSYSGEVTQPRTGQVMTPWLPQVGSVEKSSDADRRLAFADWLVDPQNPYFARIEANRIWSQLFARGIVDPIDDFRDSNPPSNAPLLDALARDFAEHGYDRKHLLRVILGSRTYQASYQTSELNRKDRAYFSHQEPRLLGAEQLLDAINHSLSLTQKFANLPEGTRSTQIPAPDLVKVDFLKIFGQPERSTVCACERADDSNLGMAIELFNGTTIHEKLGDPSNRFRTQLAAGKSVEEILRELYLASVCRLPSQIELEVAIDHCSKNSDPAVGLEDVCWALFNTDEFLFQH